MKSKMWMLAAAVVFAGGVAAQAGSVPGTYSVLSANGNGNLSLPNTSGTGPWAMSDTTPAGPSEYNDYVNVIYTLDTPVEFSSLTSISADYNLNETAAGGSPRLWMTFTNGDYAYIYLGDNSPILQATTAANDISGQNLIDSTLGASTQRYQYLITKANGGSGNWTNDAGGITTMDSLFGSDTVQSVTWVVDTDPFNVTLDSINLTTAAPLPASTWSGLALLGGLAAFGGAKRLRRQMV